MGKDLQKGTGLDAALIIEQAKDRNKQVMLPDMEAYLPQEEQIESSSGQGQIAVKEVSEDTAIQDRQEKEPQKRKRGLPSYREVFVQRNEIKRRQCVYISHEVHSVIASLVRVLVEEGGEVTVGGYIDKVLCEHLQNYKDDINAIYQRSRPDLLK